MTAEEREMMERLLGEHTSDPLEKEIARLLTEFAIEAVEKERERCAKVADGKAAEFNAKAAASVERDEWESMALGASLTAEAIRAGEV